MIFTFFLIISLFVFSACNNIHPQLPTTYVECDTVPAIIPDYQDVVIPVNIAPLNFMVSDASVEECIAEVTYEGDVMTYGEGRKILIDAEEWSEMLQKSVGQSLSVRLYTCQSGKWTRHPAFKMDVVGDSIDAYIFYRSIPPSYSTYERVTLNQRCIESFEERVIYDNKTLDDVTEGHCVNCHAFQNYKTERMQFHVRAEYAGTVIYDQGKLEKVQTKSPETISAGVYPAWHPTLDLIAYSNNLTFQNFHTQFIGKVEVQDSRGDIVVYDVKNHKVIPVSMEEDERAAFPMWSPDGKWLYYNSAHFVYQDSLAMAEFDNRKLQQETNARYEEVHYDVLRRSFDAETMSFGPAETVLKASEIGKSATVPRISPDGRYLLSSLGDYGCFHIWHPESDLYVTDLDSVLTSQDFVETGLRYTYPLTAANSERAEGFHNWSSNGRWIMVASRRYDNNYSRLYFAYFDREGVAHKAFELPQQDPESEMYKLASYNVPEFTTEPIRVSASDFAKVVME